MTATLFFGCVLLAYGPAAALLLLYVARRSALLVVSLLAAFAQLLALLALAHDQGVEADLAAAITIILENGELPDAALLRAQFTPAASPVPTVLVLTPSPAVYDDLLNNTHHMEMAA